MKFSRDILNVPHLYAFGNLAFFDIEGTRLFLNESEEWSAEESILYFSVVDINTTCNDLSENGVKCSAAISLTKSILTKMELKNGWLLLKIQMADLWN